MGLYSEIHPFLNEISTVRIADFVFDRLGTPKEPSRPRELAFNTITVVLGGGRRAFIFFSLVPTIKLLKLFSTLQESYLMMILFLPFKLILFQYGTFAVIIILLLHVIPSIMTKNAVSWGKGFALFFGGFGGFFLFNFLYR